MSDIAAWLSGLDLAEYRSLFEDNKIDLDILPEIGEEDLRSLGVPLGHRKKLMRAIRALGGDAVEPPPAATPLGHTSDQPLVSRHLAERAIRAKSALEGERKQVTVLFADIKGSTELIESLDAEDADGLLRLAVAAMRKAVQRYEGTVNKVLGDGIMAIFGAPLAHEDHAIRACYAALAMQAEMQLLTQEARRRFGVEVELRIGLNSGDVIVRTVHTDFTMDYDAIGPTVHLASRMEQLARPGTARLTAATQRLAEAYVEARPLGPVPVKGLAEPVEVFELIGAVDVRSRFQASARRGLSRFVGRDGEVEALARALGRARAGEGQAVSVVGDAGVGKSRLFYEFVQSPRLRGCLVLQSGSVSHGRAAAFQPLVDLLRNYFGLSRSDDERTVRERVMGKLFILHQSVRSTAVPILALLGIAAEDGGWPELDPAQRRRLTLDAVRMLLLNEAQVQPLAIVIEDLHWIDSETQAFLDLFVESIPRAPVLLLLNYRPEYTDRWTGKGYFAHIRLDTLSPQSGESLLRDLLGPDPSLAPLCDVILERTEGNPFFIEESVQALVDVGALAGKRGGYALVLPVRSISVPASVQAVLAARIDRLDPTVKRLLQTAAVIGKDFPLTLLQDVANSGEPDTRAYLELLQAGEFIYETRLFPEPEYTFKHALTHQVAYEGQLHDRRRDLHAAILAALERGIGPARRSDNERMAHHAMRGNLWEKAQQYATAAGLEAIAVNANRAAMTAFETALEALAKLPETEDRLAEAIDLRFRIRDVLFVLGEPAAIAAHMDVAEALSVRLDDRKRLITVLLYKSSYGWSIGQHRHQALPLAIRAFELARQSGDRESVGLACYRAATACALLGEYRESARWGALSREALEPQAETLFQFGGLVYTFACSFAALALAELGDFAAAEEAGRRGYDIAVRANHAYSETVTAFGLTHCCLLQGRITEALPILDHGLEVVATHGVQAAASWVAGRAAYAYAAAGRLEDFERASALVQATGKALTQSMRHGFSSIWSARGHLALDRFEEASEIAQQVLDHHEGDPEESVRGWAHWIVGEAARRRPASDLAQAEAHYAAAALTAQALSMRPLEAHCRVAQADAAARQGRMADADTMLGAGRRLAESIGLSGLLRDLEGAPDLPKP